MPTYYYITADGVGTLNIDSTMFDISLPGITRQYSLITQFASNGRITGTGGITPGVITMSARNRAGANATAFNAARLALMAFIGAARTSDMIFHIVHADGTTEYTVPVVPISSGAERYSSLRVSDVFQINFQMLNGYYEAATATTQTETLTTSPENITVSYSGIVPVYPVISFTPSGTISQFQIERSDGYGIQLTVDVSAGQVLTIDCRDGAIYIGSTQITGVQTGGSTFQLLPGDNVLTVYAGAGTLEIEYNSRVI